MNELDFNFLMVNQVNIFSKCDLQKKTESDSSKVLNRKKGNYIQIQKSYPQKIRKIRLFKNKTE